MIRPRGFLALLVLVVAAPLPALGGEIRLAAAASMTDALTALMEAYREADPSTVFVRTFAASGALAKQLANGAPADLFVSANPQWMEYLEKEGRVVEETVAALAFNALVVVGAPESEVRSLRDLHRLSRVALGSPRSVPAGRYARQALEAAGLWERLKRENRLVFAKDVRQALMYAERTEVDAAFVYRTDVRLATRTTVWFEVPGELYPRVTYPVALTTSGTRNPDAVSFLRFLLSPAAGAVLREHGFTVDR